jgi:hypothetical protein
MERGNIAHRDAAKSNRRQLASEVGREQRNYASGKTERMSRENDQADKRDWGSGGGGGEGRGIRPLRE